MSEKKTRAAVTRARSEKSGRKPGSKGKGPRKTPGPVLEHRLAGFVTGGEVAGAVGVAPSTIIKQAMHGAAWAKDLGVPNASYRWLVDLPAYVEEVLPTLLPEGEIVGRLDALLCDVEASMRARDVAGPAVGRVFTARQKIADVRATVAKAPARKSRRRIQSAPAAG